MGEQIPYSAASSLITMLGSAAFREYGLIHGITDNLKSLEQAVESIRAVLLDADVKQEQNDAVREWIKWLKDELHSADDLLDEFFIHEMEHKVDAQHHHPAINKIVEVFHPVSPMHLYFSADLARKIEKKEKRIQDVAVKMSVLNLIQKDVVNLTDIVKRETSSFVIDSDIIGRIDDKKDIISLLEKPHSHDGENVSFIAIVGMGGLGKTAVAQLVYNEMKVPNSFEKKMWVCVSDNFDVKTILKKMLESLINGKVEDNLSLQNIQDNLRDNLTDKRYLLVLDDIWSEDIEKWRQLKTYLMCGARGSKVLVTTREKVVAENMGIRVLHPLNGLTLEQSWILLKKMSFWDDTDTSGVNGTLEPIGRKIAKRCNGVPLAIRTLGGLLQNNSDKSVWDGVLEGEFWKLCKEKESIIPILKLSYQKLPPQLRQCFAYCSLFPKDWEIKKDELIQLWMAQGYLGSESQVMEDVGTQFIETLLMKSFFQDVTMSQWGDIVSFKMHDLMHDVAMEVAGNDCRYLDKKHPGNSLERKRLMHVMLSRDSIELLDSLDASRLRTLIILGCYGKKLTEEQLFVISNFKHLRVLKLGVCPLRNLADSFKMLKHLRCLILGHCYGKKALLKSISNLVCLQTLIVDGSLYCVKFFTQDVSKLINLIHLQFHSLLASKENKMTAIFKKLSSGNYWISSFTNIAQISLTFCRGIQYLPPLERLPFLKSLRLSALEDLEYICYEETCLAIAFFPSLESLDFFGCRELRGWWRMGDDFKDGNNSSHSHHHPLPPFPRLSLLSIQQCEMLTFMPTFPSLDKKLELVDCSMEPLVATLNIAINFPPLSKLKSLSIGGFDVEQITKDWGQNLTSLQDLEICGFSNEQVKKIEIWFVDGLNCLQKIVFDQCDNLMALPNSVCNLSSLQHIKITRCVSLRYLPEGMPNLTKLQTLEILYCPCIDLSETSANWPRIARIPNLITDSTDFGRRRR